MQGFVTKIRTVKISPGAFWWHFGKRLSLNIAQVTSTFGSFVKYTVRTVNSTSPTIRVPRLKCLNTGRGKWATCQVELQQHAKQLFLCLQGSYWERPIWQPFRNDVESLARSLSQYASYLNEEKTNK